MGDAAGRTHRPLDISAARPRWVLACLTPWLLTGCRTYIWENATITEPRDPDALEIAKKRKGETECKYFDNATLQFQRDDSYFVRVVSGLSFEGVRVQRSFAVKDGVPTVVVLAAESTDPQGRQYSGKWVRYERKIGSGVVTARRGVGSPPEFFAESTSRNRWVRNVLLSELTIPNRPFPF